MKKAVIGIVAHVDAGKTTLSEAVLYRTGQIRKLGRVDHQDTFLDRDVQERERGITIFSKEVTFQLEQTEVTLLDTPGHVDFSTETERALQVLDYAVLVVSGTDGIQAHTRTLWNLLKRYQIPVFLFINKMDLPTLPKQEILHQLQEELSEGCLDFSSGYENQAESIALLNEEAFFEYEKSGSLSLSVVQNLIRKRILFPCYVGSALKMEGVDDLLKGIDLLTSQKDYPSSFGAKVYKISHDGQERLTFLKVTGGELKVKDRLTYTGADGKPVEEKVHQIRLYQGDRFQNASSLKAGSIGAVVGLSETYPGLGLGKEADTGSPVLDSFLTYEVLTQDGGDIHEAERALRILEEEDPKLHVVWDAHLSELQVTLMGEVQLQVLQRALSDRFHLSVTFGEGHINYRETITQSVEGVGHYEPLRHYAEVHLLLEPLPRGSGVVVDSTCSEDVLDKNFQHLVRTHLLEKEHRGVLTGAPVTDIRITLIAGRSSVEHTVGGDFRQATYRAVRQGLMETKSILLEPYYQFELTLPESSVGRAMTDLDRMKAVFDAPEPYRSGFFLIRGKGPASTMRGYEKEVSIFTKGEGSLALVPLGYERCHNEEEVVSSAGYDPEGDLENSPDSVFCGHGAAILVPWDQVPAYMHIRTPYSLSVTGTLDVGEELDVNRDEGIQSADGKSSANPAGAGKNTRRQENSARPGSLEEDKELMAIFEKTYGPVKSRTMHPFEKPEEDKRAHVEIKEAAKPKEYLLVDGYNILFAWDELKKISRGSLDLARMVLMDLLCGYQSFRQCVVILVFDAYRVPRDKEDVIQYHNISVVYTKEAETADTYIERATYVLEKNHRIRVATSDGAEQVIVLGHGAERISAREFEQEVKEASKEIRETLQSWNESEKESLTQTLNLLDIPKED